MAEDNNMKCSKEAEFIHINTSLTDNKADIKELNKNVSEMMLNQNKNEWYSEQIKTTQDKMAIDNEAGFKEIAEKKIIEDKEKKDDKERQKSRDDKMLLEKKNNTRAIVVAILLMAVNLAMGLIVKWLHW